MRKYAATLSLMFLLAVALGCDLKLPAPKEASESETADAKPVRIVIPVEASHPTRGDISEYLGSVSRVEAEERVDVMPEGAGRCVAMLVDEGDTVSRGQVMAELDKESALVALRQSEIQASQNKSAYERAQRSFELGLGPEMEAENARFTWEQSEANVRAQRLQVEHLTIRAPIAGLVTKRNIQVGTLVTSGTPAFTIVDPATYRLIINPAEPQLPRLRVGQTAKVTLDSVEGEEFDAHVSKISPSVDPASGTVQVTLEFDAETRKRMREAAFARVELVMETHEDALLVPKDALVDENARTYLYVVAAAPEEADDADPDASPDAAPSESAPDANTAEAATQTQSAGSEASEATSNEPEFIAERIEVEVGIEDSQLVEVVSGVNEDDLVITVGQQSLKPGAYVRVTNTAEELEKTAGLSAEEALARAAEKRKAGAQESMGRHRRR